VRERVHASTHPLVFRRCNIEAIVQSMCCKGWAGCVPERPVCVVEGVQTRNFLKVCKGSLKVCRCVFRMHSTSIPGSTEVLKGCSRGCVQRSGRGGEGRIHA